jgi:hypothetical protein
LWNNSILENDRFRENRRQVLPDSQVEGLVFLKNILETFPLNAVVVTSFEKDRRLIGYTRVSTDDQSWTQAREQLDA